MISRRKFTKKQLADAASKNTSISGIARYLGIQYKTGATWNSIKRYLKEYEIDISHFLKGNIGKISNNKLKPSEILVFNPNLVDREKSYKLRRALLECGVEYKCIKCKNEGMWNGIKLVLNVDHIDGNWKNNIINNLRFLCPNCHSQEPTSKRPCKGYSNSIKINKICEVCSNPFNGQENGSTKCKNCNCRIASKIANSKRINTSRITWPSYNELKNMIELMPIVAISDNLGISVTMVHKKCRKLNIKTKPRGYWQKKQAGKLV